jgi:hypothetical protein
MRRHLPKLPSLLVLALALTPLVRLPARAGSALAVIVSQAVPVHDISAADLRRIFLSEPVQYASGKRFIPLNQPPQTVAREKFDRVLFGLTPSQMGAFWIDRRIRDQPAPPRTVPDTSLVARLVISLPGIISYVPVGGVTPHVRVLTIGGKAAGQPGYLLTD